MELDQPIVVASLEPAELQRGTQAVADALARTIAKAPEQWYSFKPMWPLDPAEEEVLERRAAEMQAGVGKRRGPRGATIRGNGPESGGDGDERDGTAPTTSVAPEAAAS
jgi:hypothetical protein